ncbi:MAG: phosphate ABC transporter permease subunit PstC [Phycisphaerales bacterium]
MQVSPFRRAVEWCVEWGLFVAALLSVAVTGGIVFVLVRESIPFFQHVSIVTFLTDTMWTPLFAEPRYGILPLLCGTVMTSLIALLVAVPVGTLLAIWLSEFAPPAFRESTKPLIELLAAIPTVVYGYFALLLVTPFLQRLIPELPTFNMLGPGLVMGLMIVPYVSSLSEDALRAVPMGLREASYAMGANRIVTAFRVVYPAAFSGILSAYVLAVSRAIGETMIVAIAAGQQPNLTFDPRDPAATITAYIVQVSQGDLPHESIGYQSIFAAGMTLFLFTLVFNILSAMLRRRYREAY